MGGVRVRAFDMEKFSEHIAVVRKSRGLSLFEVQEQTGVAASTICRGRMSVQTAASLADWAGLALDDYVIRAALEGDDR